MLLNQVLFGKFTPPPVVNSRRFTTMGGDMFDEPYKPSALLATINKRKAQRKAEIDKAYEYIRANPDMTAARLATYFKWGHNKACYTLDALMAERRVKRHGCVPKTGGPSTYFYKAL